MQHTKNPSVLNVKIKSSILFLVCYLCIITQIKSQNHYYLQKIELPSKFDNVTICDVETHPDGSLLLATPEGIFKKKGSYVWPLKGSNDVDATSIFIDKQGTVWAAINVAEIFCSNPDDHEDLLLYLDTAYSQRMSVSPTSSPSLISIRRALVPISMTEVLVYDIEQKRIVIKNRSPAGYNANVIVDDDGLIWLPRVEDDRITFYIHQRENLVDSLVVHGFRSPYFSWAGLAADTLFIRGVSSLHHKTLYKAVLSDSPELKPQHYSISTALLLNNGQFLSVRDNIFYFQSSPHHLGVEISHVRADQYNNIWVMDKTSNLYLLKKGFTTTTELDFVDHYFHLDYSVRRPHFVQKTPINTSDALKIQKYLPFWLKKHGLDISHTANPRTVVINKEALFLDHTNEITNLHTRDWVHMSELTHKFNVKALNFVNISDHHLIIGTSSGLYSYNLNNNQLEPFTWSDEHYINALAANDSVIAYATTNDTLYIRVHEKLVQKIHVTGIRHIQLTSNGIYLFCLNGVFNLNNIYSNKTQVLLDAYSIPNDAPNWQGLFHSDSLVLVSRDRELCYSINDLAIPSFSISIDSVLINDVLVNHDPVVVSPALNRLSIKYHTTCNEPLHSLQLDLKGIGVSLIDVNQADDEISAYFYGDQLDSILVHVLFNKSYKGIHWLATPVRLSFWQSNKLTIVTLTPIILLCIIFWIFRNVRLKKQQVDHSISRLRLNLLNSKLNPHFMFNAFTLMSSSNEKTDTHSLVTNLSGLIRKVFYSTDHKFTNLEEELELVMNLLAVQKIKYPQQFDYKIEFGDQINLKKLVLPGMSIFTFVENCVIHAFDKNHQSMLILIRISKLNDYILIEVIDNGVGLNNKRSESPGFSSGVKSLRERLNLFRQIYNLEYNFVLMNDIDENNQTNGTIGIIYFKAQEII